MQMITRNEIKLIQSLSRKKFRKIHSQFVIEGEKVVKELLDSDFRIHKIFGSENWIRSNPNYSAIYANEKDLKLISQFSSPNEVVVIAEIPEDCQFDDKDSVLILDGINDPGNLGTIIRSADWFGIKQILCSQDTVDCYSHKVVQSSMGSIFRVQIDYRDLSEFLSTDEGISYGAFLEGESINVIEFSKPSRIVIGSESHGIRENIENLIEKKITIPKYGKAESLNAGVATSIILNKFSECK